MSFTATVAIAFFSPNIPSSLNFWVLVFGCDGGGAGCRDWPSRHRKTFSLWMTQLHADFLVCHPERGQRSRRIRVSPAARLLRPDFWAYMGHRPPELAQGRPRPERAPGREQPMS